MPKNCEHKCGTCAFFEETPEEVIPSLKWEGEMQDVTVITPEYEGVCTHEYNWRPSRGDMPRDKDHSCSKWEEMQHAASF